MGISSGVISHSFFIKNINSVDEKCPQNTRKLILEGNFLPLYVILRREYAHSFQGKTLSSVGFYPLIFGKIAVSSGAKPTRFDHNRFAFEWVSTPPSS